MWAWACSISCRRSSRATASWRRPGSTPRNAAERKEVAAEQVNNEIQAAYTLYLQSYAELETQQKSVELARQNYQVVNNRYLNQLALITDMIDATNMKLDAELGEVDARINIAYAYYKMKYIAGQL